MTKPKQSRVHKGSILHSAATGRIAEVLSTGQNFVNIEVQRLPEDLGDRYPKIRSLGWKYFEQSPWTLVRSG